MDRERTGIEEERDSSGSGSFRTLLHRHRIAVAVRILVIVAALAGIAALVAVQLRNRSYTDYTVRSSVEKTVYEDSTNLSFADGFVTYSRDGISYTTYQGASVWNLTYEMENPMVRTAGTQLVVADYGGHMVYCLDETGETAEIDTNLPIRELAVSQSGVSAAVLEDGSTTWIYIYDSMGELAAYQKTTMQKSGYPQALALSPSGSLMAVSYITVEDGETKSSVAFYNFSSVGQNYTDNLVSGADYADAVVATVSFMDEETSFAVADNRLVFYSGEELPKSIADVLINDEIQSVFYNESNVGLVFMNTSGGGKYRLNVYNTSGLVETTLEYDIEYRDILLTDEGIVIYSDTECLITTFAGKERYSGEFDKQYILFSPISGSRYMALAKDSIDVLTLK